MTRRELARLLAAAGLGAPLARRSVADELPPPRPGEVPEGQLVPVTDRPRFPAQLRDGRIVQPERPLPVLHETDVLVVGGGPAGWSAAVAAARAGVKVTIAERYGYFGGLWAGGLVLLVYPTHAREGGQPTKVVRGVGDELLGRLAKVNGALVAQSPDRRNPTTDPEATKYLMDEMIGEAGVDVFFHCWAADVVMDGPTVRGVVFESKSGRQAILARVVVDATGDGDIFAAAGAAHEQRLHAIGLVHRLGNVDHADTAALQAAGFRTLGSVEPLPSVQWVNLRGPSTDGLDVRVLSRLERQHRAAIWKRVQKERQVRGAESLFLLQTAPQLGVRITRILAGTRKLLYAEARRAQTFPDTIGVGGDSPAERPGWPIPYGTLVPRSLDGLLAAGRCIDVEDRLMEDMRLIATCLVTGHAAGAAAALAVQSKVQPRAVDIPALQKLLRAQGAYLGPS